MRIETVNQPSDDEQSYSALAECMWKASAALETLERALSYSEIVIEGVVQPVAAKYNELKFFFQRCLSTARRRLEGVQVEDLRSSLRLEVSNAEWHQNQKSAVPIQHWSPEQKSKILKG